MKSVFPLLLISSLTMVTACGGKSSSGSGKAPTTPGVTTETPDTTNTVAGSYAEQNKDRCITDPIAIKKLYLADNLKINASSDVIISDGCLEKTSDTFNVNFLTDLKSKMRIDLDDTIIHTYYEQLLSEIDIESLENLKKMYYLKISYSEPTGAITFKDFGKENADMEIVSIKSPGKYDILMHINFYSIKDNILIEDFSFLDKNYVLSVK